MIELLAIYKYAFLLCPLAAAVLCIYGTHLVSRNEGLQLMALSQAALVGNIVGHLFATESHLASLLLSIVFFILLKVGLSFLKHVQEQTYIVVYLSLVALSYFVVTLFPGLDSHFAVGFFGDIVSLSTSGSIILSALFLALLIASLLFHPKLIKTTFNRSVLNSKEISLWEEILFVSGILISLYGLGFLFTLSFLIFPILIAGRNFKNLKQSLFIMSIVAASASVTGLMLSIIHSRVSTVPAQILILVGFMVFVRWGLSIARRA